VDSFMLPPVYPRGKISLYTFDRRFGVSQIQSRRGDEKNSCRSDRKQFGTLTVGLPIISVDTLWRGGSNKQNDISKQEWKVVLNSEYKELRKHSLLLYIPHWSRCSFSHTINRRNITVHSHKFYGQHSSSTRKSMMT
jgi:hypothetical protein